MATTVIEERSVSVNGTELHIRLHGDTAAPPVVVLHGIMGHAREWDALITPLATEHHVVALDQRGHGRAGWPGQYSPALLADDLVSVVEALELAPVRLVGHSMGGMAALLATARRPDLVERLVVIDIGPDSVRPEHVAELRAFVAWLARSSYESVDDAVAAWAGNPLARPELLRHYVEHCLAVGDDDRLRWRFDGVGLDRFFDAVDSSALWEAVDRISCPTLVVRGEHSPVLSAAAAAAVVDRLAVGCLVEIPGASHDLGVERPEAVAAAAQLFFA